MLGVAHVRTGTAGLGATFLTVIVTVFVSVPVISPLTAVAVIWISCVPTAADSPTRSVPSLNESPSTLLALHVKA